MKPYLKFELDAVERCPLVASACGLSSGEVSWGLLQTWRHCWRTESLNVSDLQVGAFFGVLDIQKTCDALAAFGFILRQDSGWFVPDMEASVKAKIAQREGGKKGRAASSSPIGRTTPRQPPAQGSHNPTANPPTTPRQALTASSYQLPANSKEAFPLSESKAPKVKAQKVEKPTDPRHAPAVSILMETYRACTGVVYGFTPRDAAAVKQLLALGETPEIDRRWRTALAHNGFPRVATLSELVTHWNHFGTASRNGVGAIGDFSHLPADGTMVDVVL